MKDIEFWFSIGSTYSYLSVARLPALECDTGVTVSWHPFSVRKLMQEMDNIPFPPTKKAKVDYMWRDIERRAQKYDIPCKSLIWRTRLQCLECRKGGVSITSVPPIADGFRKV